MRAAVATRRGQRRAEMLMTDRARVTEVVGEDTDPVTGEVTDVVEVRYDGPCKVQSNSGQGNEPSAGGHKYLVVTYQVHFPIGSNAKAGFGSGTQVMIAESRNSDLVGRVLRLTEPDLRSFNTADRWNSELVIS